MIKYSKLIARTDIQSLHSLIKLNLSLLLNGPLDKPQLIAQNIHIFQFLIKFISLRKQIIADQLIEEQIASFESLVQLCYLVHLVVVGPVD